MDAASIYGSDIPGRHFSNAIITWKIKNFSFVNIPDKTRKLSSEIITLVGPIPTRWRLFLEDSHDKDSLILYLDMLKTNSEVQKVKVKWESYISNICGGASFEQERSYSFVPGCILAVEMFKLRYLLNELSTTSPDELEIKCHMLVDFGYRPSYCPDALKYDLGRLPKSSIYHDIIAKINDTEFTLHRAMLCRRSKKLAELTEKSFMNMAVSFPFCDVKAAEAVFTYLYTGDLSCIVANPSLTICELIDRLAIPEMQNIYPKETINLLSEIEGKNFSFEWIIPNFKTLKEPLESKMFYENGMGSRWKFLICPTLSETDIGKQVESILIVAIVSECDKPIDVSLECSVVSLGISMKLKRTQGKVSKGSRLQVSFFESVDEVLNCLWHNSLSLIFKIREFADNLTSSIDTVPFEVFPVSIQQSYANFTRVMTALKGSLDYSDAFIEVGKRTYKVHKFLMAARSPVFEEILRTQDTIKFPDNQGKCMEQLIKFFYTGTITENNFENVLQLLEISESSNITSLQVVCERLLPSLITNENALQILIWAHTRCKQKLISSACLHIIKNHEEVMKGECWDYFCGRMPDLSAHIKNSVCEMCAHIDRVTISPDSI